MQINQLAGIAKQLVLAAPAAETIARVMGAELWTCEANLGLPGDGVLHASATIGECWNNSQRGGGLRMGLVLESRKMRDREDVASYAARELRRIAVLARQASQELPTQSRLARSSRLPAATRQLSNQIAQTIARVMGAELDVHDVDFMDGDRTLGGAARLGLGELYAHEDELRMFLAVETISGIGDVSVYAERELLRIATLAERARNLLLDADRSHTPATIVSLGNRNYRIGNNRPICVSEPTDWVLKSYLEREVTVMTLPLLVDASGHNRPDEVLKALLKKHPEFDRAIEFPLEKGDGYRVSIAADDALSTH